MVVTSYGRAGSEDLATAIGAAKAGVALAPVTVIVPSNFAGLAARRILGSGLLGGSGIANVNFFTAFRLAELLAVGRLRGRRPLTNPILGSAVRATLADEPGQFRNVRDHQATEQALSAAVGELSNVSGRGLEAISAEGGFAGSVVKIHHAVRDRLGSFHDEAEVARAATHRSDLAEALSPFGPIIWYLPGVTTAPLASFMGSVCQVASATVIVALSGTPRADAQVRRSLRIAGLELAGGAAGRDTPLASHFLSVTDADEEVRQVVREVVGLVEAGTPLDRIGVFHPVPDPYVRLLEQHFAAAEIPANGPSRRRLSESVAGRVLLAALRLPAERWRRDRVVALLSNGPIRDGEDFARPAAWDALSRQAGVVIDLRDWHAKLGTHRTWLEHQRSEGEQLGHTRRVEHLDRDLADVDALGAWVERVAAAVGAVGEAVSWQERATQGVELLRVLLGPPHRLGSWPEAEQVAFEQVEAALDRLSALDELEPEPSLAVFTRALTTELSVARSRSGRFGEGVVYGPLATAPGHDLDAVFVLGCAEGILPAPRREDALLPDWARELTGGDLTPRLGELHEQHRLFLAALAAAPVDRRWLLFPRGDLRSSRRARPSRWLLPSVSALTGNVLRGTDFEHETPHGLVEIASHAEAIATATHSASLLERDLGEVWDFVRNHGGRAVDHDAAAGVRRGLELQHARAGAAFTAFDGNLAGQALPTTDDHPQSASRLETWARCGFRYYLRSVLDIGDRDDPERVVEISALDRGSAMHAILEAFYVDAVEAGAPAPDEPWSDAQRARALELAQQTFEGLEQRGRTGRAVLWGSQQTELLASIGEFLTKDDDHRQRHRAVPHLFEQAFGLDGEAAVEIPIANGRSLRFRGYIDRIDRTEGMPGRFIVSDYKTGSGSQYPKKLDSEPDPTLAGRLLQLGLYAEAAHQLLGATSVDTRYWMVNPKAKYQRIGYEWSDERRARLHEVVATIVDGIESGVFAAAPGEWDAFRRTYDECVYCEFDPICPRDRAEHAAQKLDAPELEVRVSLTHKPDQEVDA